MRNVQVREQWKRASRFGVGGISQLLKILLSCVLLFLSIPLTIAQDNSKNVLMLFSSFGRDIAWPNKIEPLIRARVLEPIAFYEAYIEGQDANGENDSFRQSMAETFRRRYAGKKLDLVITNGPHALDFVQHYLDRISPGVPVVFSGLSAGRLGGCSASMR